MAIAKKLLFCILAAMLLSPLAIWPSMPSNAWADGMEEVPQAKVRKPVRQAPIEQPVRLEQPAPASVEPAVVPGESCEWKVRLSPGATIWFFEEEGDVLSPHLSMDVWRTDYPINFHVGVEARHMWLGQENAEFAREWDDKTTRVTFVRVPFALEYMAPLAEDTTWYIGAGPDILHTANDITDTSVGFHASARLHYAFDPNWGMAVEAGYMWGQIDGQGSDISLDNAFITPTVAYTF